MKIRIYYLAFSHISAKSNRFVLYVGEIAPNYARYNTPYDFYEVFLGGTDFNTKRISG